MKLHMGHFQSPQKITVGLQNNETKAKLLYDSTK